jgi:4-hydroxy-3-polyprenylbenzoate decarboxylase
LEDRHVSETALYPAVPLFALFCSEIGTRRPGRRPAGQGDGLRIVVGISGASGAIYGLRLLERLRIHPSVEIHLILSRSGEKTLFLETGKTAADARKMSDYSYPLEDIGCRLASGSYPTDAMVIAPCSIHTMSAIAQGISSNLMVRAADVALKERRKLILVVRESPFHLGHLKNMTALAEMGAIIAPPIPGFYHNPRTVMDIVDQSLDRVLDLIGLPDPAIRRWEGGAA